MKIEIDVEEYPEFDDGGITVEDYAELWRYARLRTGGELYGLLALGEMIDRTSNPLHELTKACSVWLSDTNEQMRAEAEAADDAVVH